MAAITGRGRKRDFSDIYFLLKYFSLAEMLDMFTQKYPDSNRFLVVKSLNYFEDAEEDEDPVFFQQADWKTIRKTLDKEVKTLLI